MQKPYSDPYQFIYNGLMPRLQQPYQAMAPLLHPQIATQRSHDELVDAAARLPRAPVEDIDTLMSRGAQRSPLADMWNVLGRQSY